MPQQPLPLSPQAQQFIAAVSKLAGQHGVKLLVIGLQDPAQPMVQSIVGTPGAAAAVREEAKAFFQLVDAAEARAEFEGELQAESAWPG